MTRKRRLDRLTDRKTLDLKLKNISFITVELPTRVTGVSTRVTETENHSGGSKNNRSYKVNLSSRPSYARKKALENFKIYDSNSSSKGLGVNVNRNGSLLIEGVIDTSTLGLATIPVSAFSAGGTTQVQSDKGANISITCETLGSILEHRRGLLSIFLVKDKLNLNVMDARNLIESVPTGLRTSTRTPYDASLIGLRAVLGGIEVELLATNASEVGEYVKEK